MRSHFELSKTGDENMITSRTVVDACGIDLEIDNCVGLANADQELADGPYMTFCESPRFIEKIRGNPGIGLTLIPESLLPEVYGMNVRVVDDPKWVFFSIVNHLARIKPRQPSRIGERCSIHPSAHISEVGVVIGDEVTIEPNVTVLSDVIIGRGSIIRAGAVVGVNGFEHKRTSKGILSVEHDGDLIVEGGVEIGPNNTIVKGFSYRDTRLGEDSKLDGLVHYAHGVQCGPRCLIAGAAMISGHVTIGADVWIGPNASISNRLRIGDGASIALGATVTRDVPAHGNAVGTATVDQRRWSMAKSLMQDVPSA